MQSDADRLIADARRLQATGDIASGIAAAQRAVALDHDHVGALEFLATALITRKRKYVEGLELIDRAASAAPDDAGTWYARGWCYEFAAHELQRRPVESQPLAPEDLYTVAAESFLRCLALRPEGKLRDDAQDLLDHVENELARVDT